ncbi:HET domain-containing protein [Rutstroemia sp. NJR-2017a BBW]|nr:HET domain-containing protein [Rutstroemia sp. NJR-2017a BBW]
MNGSQQLCLFESEGQVGRWVALTYCWGDIPFLQTTSDNIEALRREIDLSSLPQTFQDAVTITRQLGIRYLWIDALCIQQDSIMDWRTESANMPAIYTNAYVTIAAVGAQNSHHGMLNPRSWASDFCEVRLSERSTINFRMIINHETEIDFLSRRAWCLQEKVLSPRVLSFGSSQMTYTCLSSHLTEGNYVRDARKILQTKNDLYTRVAQVSRSNLGDNIFYDASLRKLHRYWYSILADYTRRTLTLPGDKLTAISGVANYIRRETSYEYLAGLWKESLPQALLWQNPSSMQTRFQEAGCLHFREKVKIYRAPSCSWAAVDGPVNFGDCVKDLEQPQIHRLVPECTILACEVTCDSVDPCGQVSGGYIKINGPLKQTTCHPSYGPVHCYDYHVAVLLDSDKHDPQYSWDCTGIFDVRELPKGRQIWCLQITTAFGLMLLPTVGEMGTFQRVGKFLLRCIGPETYCDWFKDSKRETIIIV